MIGGISILLLVIIVLTIITLFWVIRSLVIDDYDQIIGSIIVLIIVIGLIGWGVIGSLVDIGTESHFYDKSDVSVEKTDNIILVNTPSGVFIYNRKSDFDNINDSTQFSNEVDFNMYGKSINQHSVYYYDNNRVRQFGKKLR